MKRYILFGLTLLMAFPVCVSAQEDLDDDDAQEVKVRRVAATKKYETRTVKGSIRDATTGEPLSGAIVKAAGINGFSALTGDDGSYELKVPLFVSAVTVTAPDYNSEVIGLSAGEEQGELRLFSTVFASDFSTDVNILNNQIASDFSFSNAINIKEEVQKQLGAYAYTTQRNGTPGIGSVTFIQGLNSLNVNAQPLVVVDGVILDQQYSRSMLHDGLYNDVLTNINPADIEDVTIIRNGTALYGARGANGVIEIKTKRSHSMATRITANISAGITAGETNYYPMMDAEQYRGYASELLKGVNTDITSFKFLSADPNYYYYNIYHCNTDWKKHVYRKSKLGSSIMSQNYGISVEGGDDVANYNLSVGYTMADSPLKFNDMSRLNIRFNSDIILSEKLDVRFDASFSNITRDVRDDAAPTSYIEGTPTAPSFLAYVKSPFLSPYTYGVSDGVGSFSSSFLDVTDEAYLDEALAAYSNYNYQLGNPVALNEYAEAENKNRFENSMLNISVMPKYFFRNNLALSEHFSYTLVNTNNRYYVPVNGVPSYYVTSVSAKRENEVSSLASKQNSIYSDTRLAWNNRYEGHNVAAFGGVRMNFESYSTNMQLGYNTGSDKTPFMHANLKNAQANGADESWRNVDWYAQGNYDYLGRYFVQLNLTASASSRFGTEVDGGVKLFGVKWGIFPAIQASWVVSNEPWFPKNIGVNSLRLTAGYDVSGNDDINIFAAKSYFASSLYLGSPQGVAGLTFAGIGNTNIKWETTRRFNAGIQASIIDNRISLGVNFFKSSTIDLLSLQQLGFLTGIKENWGNNGRLQNTGVDFNIRGKILSHKDYTWEMGASIGSYGNKITDLGLADGKNSMISTVATASILTQEGKAANLFYGYKTKGVFSTTEQAKAAGLYVIDANGVDKHYFGAGDINFVDLNGDKEINEKDMTVIGDPNPDIYGNVFTSLTYKRFRLDANFTYCIGNDVFNYMRSQLEGGSRFMNQTLSLTQRWQREGQVTDVPQITFQDPMGNSRFSDRWIEDGSFLKLKSLTLSYNLPMNYTFLQGLEFWLQGNNLFTLTKYLGSDPEFSATSSVIGQGIDFGSIGANRSVVAGVKIKL